MLIAFFKGEINHCFIITFEKILYCSYFTKETKNLLVRKVWAVKKITIYRNNIEKVEKEILNNQTELTAKIRRDLHKFELSVTQRITYGSKKIKVKLDSLMQNIYLCEDD